ncbi:DUF72 domain-containing protein [soil metagenome]
MVKAAAKPKKKPASTSGVASHGSIRVGVGGWNFEPWRSNFYPEGLSQAKELHYASRQLTAIEINSTFYGSQKPATFAKWRDDTPEGFMFSLKASRFATNRRVLAEAGESVERFIGSGIAELGPKLGPIVWQFAATKVFDPSDFEAFVRLLPAKVGGISLRHALDVRHASFMSPEYLCLAREHGCATVFTDSDDYPSFADLTGPFVYCRLMRTKPTLKAGVAPKALDTWAHAARTWAEGRAPNDLPRVEPAPAAAHPRDVFMYFISGAKEKAPAAAMALLKRLV